MKTNRKFSGKTYKFEGFEKNKTEARKDALRWRARGFNARYIKVPATTSKLEKLGNYAIYIRKKK